MKKHPRSIALPLIATVLATTLVTGSVFSAMYLRVSRTADATDLAHRENAKKLQDQLSEEQKKNTSLRGTVTALQNEADALEGEAQALREENDRLLMAQKEEEERAEETIVPPTYSDYRPGKLLPRDPDTLSYAYHLEKQLERLKALENAVLDPALIVTPDGEIVKVKELSFGEDEEILYKDVEGTAYDENGVALQRVIDWEKMGYKVPKISVAYKDLEQGTLFHVGGEEEWFSASLIKAPYIYTLLLQMAKYREIAESNPTNDPALGDTVSKELREKFDPARVITVTEDRIYKGSGVIDDMEFPPEGIDFTILELIDYSIRHSDNTAFKVLRDEFGYEHFWAVSKELGVTSIRKSFNKLTANEALIYLTAIYDFAKEYPEEGGTLIALMKESNHSLIITPAMPNRGDVAHKYGWDEDTYHDMAIVYGDTPFALVIMTNFDIALNNPTINECLGDIAAAVYEIHTEFYDEVKLEKIAEEKKNAEAAKTEQGTTE